MTLYFDIDGTLTHDGEHKWGMPNSDLIDAVRAAKKNGHFVVLWSARGATYAKAFARRYRFSANAYLAKPDVCFDDIKSIRPPEKMRVLGPEKIWSWLTAHGVPKEAQ